MAAPHALRITRIGRAFNGSACRAVLAFAEDDSQWVIKAPRGNVPGCFLVADMIGSQLALYLGLPVPECRILDLAPDAARSMEEEGVPVSSGPVFGSRYIPMSLTWDGRPGMLRQAAQPRTMAGLIALDTWLLNPDRFAPHFSTSLNGRTNPMNVLLAPRPDGSGLEMLAVDHSHCFEGDVFALRPGNVAPDFRQKLVYGRFPEWSRWVDRGSVREIEDRLREPLHEPVQRALRACHPAWGLLPTAFLAVQQWIIERGQLVGEHLEDWLEPFYWSQSTMSLDEQGYGGGVQS